MDSPTSFEGVKKEAEGLGFILEDREWDADDIVEDEDGKEKEVRVHCRAYKVIFPPDYPHPFQEISKDESEQDMIRSLRQMIQTYHNHFTEAKNTAEWNREVGEAMERLRKIIGKSMGEKGGKAK